MIQSPKGVKPLKKKKKKRKKKITIPEFESNNCTTTKTAHTRLLKTVKILVSYSKQQQLIKRNNRESCSCRKWNTHNSKLWDICESMTTLKRSQGHKPAPGRMDKVGKLI